MGLPVALQRQEEEAQRKFDDQFSEEEEAQEQEAVGDEELAGAEEGHEYPPAKEDDPKPPAGSETDEQKINYEDEYNKLSHKYSVLEGKYNVEVPQLHKALSDMRAEITSLATKKEEPAPEPAYEGDPAAKLVEDYGEEFVDDLRAFFKNETGQDDFELRVSSVEKQSLSMAQQKYFNDLTQAVPTWQTIRQDPRFHAFVQQEDQFTGMARFRLMEAAESNFDARRIAAFYNAFLQSVGDTSKPKPAGDKGGKKEKALTPGGAAGRTGADAGGDADRAKYVSRAEIKQFGEDAKLGRYRGREKEEQQMEQRINTALANGWVIG